MDQCHGDHKCSCMHHKMVPFLVVLLGLAFLLKAFGVFSAYTTDMIWPILLILVGLQKMMGGKCKCCGMPMEPKQ